MELGGPSGLHALARRFKQTDVDENRQLDKMELKEWLRRFGLDISSRELDDMFTFFDKDRSGGVTLEELISGLRGKLSRRRMDMVHKAFDTLDLDGDGVITLIEISQVYNATEDTRVKSGTMTEREVLQEFLGQWDTGEKDGEVTEEEFIEYYRSVSASIDGDDYFELMMRNAWHISGGTGQSANTANRRKLVTGTDGRQRVVEETTKYWGRRKQPNSPTGSIRSVDSETRNNSKTARRQERDGAALTVQSHFRKLKGKMESDFEKRKVQTQEERNRKESETMRRQQKRFIRPALKATHGF